MTLENVLADLQSPVTRPCLSKKHDAIFTGIRYHEEVKVTKVHVTGT